MIRANQTALIVVTLAALGCAGVGSAAGGGAQAGTGAEATAGGSGATGGGNGGGTAGGGAVIGNGGVVTSNGGNASLGGGVTGSAGSGGAAIGGGATATGGSSGATSGGGGGVGGAQSYPTPTAQHLAVGAHDPSMIHVGSTWYLFATGGTLSIRSSTDLVHWNSVGNIFSKVPDWIATELGQTITALWAPDISFYNGLYHVYYAGSVFGSNHSVIGLATNKTLDKTSADYAWVDQGLIIESNKAGGAADNWNAIDPNLAYDAAGQTWLSWGSFWSGIKLRQVDATTGKLSTTNATLYSLTSATGSHGPEASSIIYDGGYYYLFVSFDACCQNVNSTYNTRIGRSTAITGPYLDSAGNSMFQVVTLGTTGRYIGPGGGTAFRDGDLYYYAYHYYDGQANGAPTLMLRPVLSGAAGDSWITLGTPLWQ